VHFWQAGYKAIVAIVISMIFKNINITYVAPRYLENMFMQKRTSSEGLINLKVDRTMHVLTVRRWIDTPRN